MAFFEELAEEQGELTVLPGGGEAQISEGALRVDARGPFAAAFDLQAEELADAALHVLAVRATEMRGFVVIEVLQVDDGGFDETAEQAVPDPADAPFLSRRVVLVQKIRRFVRADDPGGGARQVAQAPPVDVVERFGVLPVRGAPALMILCRVVVVQHTPVEEVVEHVRERGAVSAFLERELDAFFDRDAADAVGEFGQDGL